MSDDEKPLGIEEIAVIVGIVGALVSAAVIGFVLGDARGAVLAGAIVMLVVSICSIVAALALSRARGRHETPTLAPANVETATTRHGRRRSA